MHATDIGEIHKRQANIGPGPAAHAHYTQFKKISDKVGPANGTFGNNFDTRDGSGERDYIHVCDLVNGHIKALENLDYLEQFETINLGTGKGTTVFEMLNIFMAVNHVKVPYELVSHRSGDLPISITKTDLAKLKLKIVELLHSDHPWLTYESIKILNNELKSDFIGFEFGSGRSTLWLSKKIKFLTSIEHSEEYYIKVNKEIAKNSIVNCSLLHQTGKDYYKILQSQSDYSIDFILIDGIFRDKLLEIALQKISKRGIICFIN